ncbi:MAG: 50S ribosomal protein L6 [Candidatus Omnitrophota bacterium]|jgi:large subunit ribosomal protein L6|nr:MAG: 50S ribosomal protein L6 [Candidatus Omnitrophota bacterium]
MSRIGKKPIVVPKEVKVDLKEKVLNIEGPKGKLVLSLFDSISAEYKDNVIILGRNSDTKLDKSLHGLTRALIYNMVKGVTEGYKKSLDIIGVGFRAQVQGKVLNLQLRFSHPVNYAIPEGIKIETPKANQVIISGIDKEKVGEVAAEIRAVCPPEPYKGTGIRYTGELVKKKVGKAQASTK